MRFAFIQEHRNDYPVQLMCRLLEVSRSGYYAWLKRADKPSERHKRQMDLVHKIRQVHQQSQQRYGSPKVYHELKALGEQVCENTVAKLMKQNGIYSIVKRRFRMRTTDSNHRYPIAANVLDQQFEQSVLNQTWCADITYIATDEGWLYLSAVMDLCSRKIVGWSMADHLRASMCVEALEMAVGQRKPKAGLLHHSDRGVQYACSEYQQKLSELKMNCSMSARGNCYDNAVMESFFKTLKAELVYQRKFATRAEAQSAIFAYIETFYNRRRRHSSLGYLSPQAYEESLN